MFGFFPWKNDPIWLINIFQFGLVQPPISWGFPFENKLPRFFFTRQSSLAISQDWTWLALLNAYRTLGDGKMGRWEDEKMWWVDRHQIRDDRNGGPCEDRQRWFASNWSSNDKWMDFERLCSAQSYPNYGGHYRPEASWRPWIEFFWEEIVSDSRTKGKGTWTQAIFTTKWADEYGFTSRQRGQSNKVRALHQNRWRGSTYSA